MIKKPAHELADRLLEVHIELEGVLADYLGEYADYGWDAACEELRNICAGLDALMTLFKHSVVKEQPDCPWK